MNTSTVIIRSLGQQDYVTCWQAMQRFTHERNTDTPDEIWLLTHFPVFTQGQNGKPEHILNSGDVPVVQVDRGGQVTYHGPGQLVVYTLVDLKRKQLNVREMVSILEQTIIQLLAEYEIHAIAKREAPGVYVMNKKICSIGLRIRKGCAYHGLAFNVDMDLTPFTQINPCGFKQLTMTQLKEFIPLIDWKILENKLIDYLTTHLRYNKNLMETSYARETP